MTRGRYTTPEFNGKAERRIETAKTSPALRYGKRKREINIIDLISYF